MEPRDFLRDKFSEIEILKGKLITYPKECSKDIVDQLCVLCDDVDRHIGRRKDADNINPINQSNSMKKNEWYQPKQSVQEANVGKVSQKGKCCVEGMDKDKSWDEGNPYVSNNQGTMYENKLDMHSNKMIVGSLKEEIIKFDNQEITNLNKNKSMQKAKCCEKKEEPMVIAEKPIIIPVKPIVVKEKCCEAKKEVIIEPVVVKQPVIVEKKCCEVKKEPTVIVEKVMPQCIKPEINKQHLEEIKEIINEDLEDLSKQNKCDDHKKYKHKKKEKDKKKKKEKEKKKKKKEKDKKCKCHKHCKPCKCCKSKKHHRSEES